MQRFVARAGIDRVQINHIRGTSKVTAVAGGAAGIHFAHRYIAPLFSP
jgi:hypothetical protein